MNISSYCAMESYGWGVGKPVKKRKVKLSFSNPISFSVYQNLANPPPSADSQLSFWSESQ